MKSTKITIGIIVFIIFCIGTGIIVANRESDSSAATAVPATTAPSDKTTGNAQTQTPPATISTETGSHAYKDGTYTATGSYDSPAGTEGVEVSVTLKGDLITNSTVTSEANDGTSRRYQGIFIADYKPYVVGKNIADVNLGKVSGSSLTGIGFDAALAKIKAEAKA